MKERDKELEDNDVYRRKIRHESLDLINTNLSNMLGCISELESIINKVGHNQDSLITWWSTQMTYAPLQKKKPQIRKDQT